MAIGIVLLLLMNSTHAEELCPKEFLAHRLGSETCWVEYALGSNKYLCISHFQWIQWLKNKDSQSLCGEWTGKWRVFSPPENDSRNRGVKKKVYFRFYSKLFFEERKESLRFYFKIRKNIELARENISNFFKTQDSIGVLRKLILDESKPNPIFPLYRVLGFVHIFSASGIHLYCLAIGIFWILSCMSQFFRFPVSLGLFLSRVGSVFIWSLAWVLSGMRPGMFRPWIIVCARFMATQLGMRWQPFAPLVMSLFVDGLVAVFYQDWAPGRLHYALAVGGGMMALEFKKEKSFTRHFRLAFGSWIFIAFLDIYHTGLVSVMTPPISLITLPVFTILIYPLCFLMIGFSWMGFEKLAHILLFLLSGASHFILKFLGTLSMKFYGVWVVPLETLFFGILCAMFFYLMKIYFYKNKWMGFYFIIFIFILRILFLIEPITNPSLANQINQLDVGQGDAVLVMADGGSGLIDSGKENAVSDTGWMGVLAQRGIHEISWIGLTHLDADHSGGVLQLARLLPIRCVVTSREELNSERGMRYEQKLKALGVPVGTWESGCFPFSYFVAVPKIKSSGRKHKTGSKNGNENMSAIWIPLRSGAAYVSMGDAGFDQEMQFAKMFQERHLLLSGKRLILKISHHGSKYSTSKELLDFLHPKEAWISVGLGNSYGHPAGRVLQLLEREHILYHRTDLEGVLVNFHQ